MDPIFEHCEWLYLRNLRPATIVARRNTLRRVERHVGPLAHATPEAFHDWRATRTCEARAIACDISHIKQFYKWATIHNVRRDDPSLRLIRPRLRQGLPRPITETDLARALAGANDRVRPWLVLAAYCGLRAGEIATLRGEDILTLDDGPAILVHDGKSTKQRIIATSPVVVDALGPYRRRGPVFVKGDGQQVGGHLVSILSNRELRALEVDATLHQLRHRFATQVYQLTLDLRLVQDLLGHASPAMTALYAAFAPGAARVATDQLVAGLS